MIQGFANLKIECDVVSNFDVSKDKIALELGLEYSDLTFEDDGSDCFIKKFLRLIFFRS